MLCADYLHFMERRSTKLKLKGQIMKILKSGVAALIFSAAAFHANAEDKTLNLYSWSGFFDQKILDDFTAKTGYKVRYDVFETDEMLETKLLTGSSGYDLVTPSGLPFLPREIKAGAVRTFDTKLVPNISKLDPAIADLLKVSDPEANHSTVVVWGSTGMALNIDKIKKVFPDAPLDSYDLVFKPENAAKLAKCGFVVVDSATDVVPIAMHYLGIDTFSDDEKQIDKAISLLKAIRPYITYMETTKYKSDLADGSICAAIGWSGDVIAAGKTAIEAKTGVKLSYVVPKEGTLAWLTAMAIPSDASNPQAAYAFMNYVLDPKVSARITETSGYASPVTESKSFLPPELAEDQALFPSDSVKKRFFMGSSQNPATVRYVNREWTRFKTGE